MGPFKKGHVSAVPYIYSQLVPTYAHPCCALDDGGNSPGVIMSQMTAVIKAGAIQACRLYFPLLILFSDRMKLHVAPPTLQPPE